MERLRGARICATGDSNLRNARLLICATGDSKPRVGTVRGRTHTHTVRRQGGFASPCLGLLLSNLFTAKLLARFRQLQFSSVKTVVRHDEGTNGGQTRPDSPEACRSRCKFGRLNRQWSNSPHIGRTTPDVGRIKSDNKFEELCARIQHRQHIPRPGHPLAGDLRCAYCLNSELPGPGLSVRTHNSARWEISHPPLQRSSRVCARTGR